VKPKRTGHPSARLSVLALALCAIVSACGDARGNFPAEIELEGALLVNADGFFREGCHVSVYRVSERTVARLRSRGVALLRGHGPRNDEAPAFREWLESPVSASANDQSDPLFDLGPPEYAIAGCGDDNPYERQIESALLEPGSFYSLTENGEGMLVVAPKTRIAAFMYVG
jgi:hypothetical protein